MTWVLPIKGVGTAATFATTAFSLQLRNATLTGKRKHISQHISVLHKLEPPSKFQSLFFFVSETSKPKLDASCHHQFYVLKAKLSLAYGYTSYEHHFKHWWWLRRASIRKATSPECSINRVSFYELFISNDCIPQSYLHSIEAGSLDNCTKDISHILPTAIKFMGFPDLTSLVSHYCSSQP